MIRRRKTAKFKEGDVFTFPLRSGGYAIGLITRVSEDKTPLGYFFNKKYETMPAGIEQDLIKKENSILIKRFGVQGFMDETWANLGQLENFKREDWKVPVFIRETNPFPARLVYYTDSLEEIKVIDTPKGTNSQKYYGDGLPGSGAVEIIITAYFEGKESPIIKWEDLSIWS